MPKANTVAVFEHKSFRLEAGILRKVETIAETTGWSTAKVLNVLAAHALAIYAGNSEGPTLRKTIEQAQADEADRQKAEKILAPLREKARKAREALAPLVQRIKRVTKKGAHKKAA